MCRIMFDTNVLIDAEVPSRPSSDAAYALVMRVSVAPNGGCVCGTSLKDVYYVISKVQAESEAREYVRRLIEIFEVLPVDGDVCRHAATSDEPDFEDGLIRAAAELNGIDFIVTRDTEAFRHSTVRAVSAEECLEILGS